MNNGNRPVQPVRQVLATLAVAVALIGIAHHLGGLPADVVLALAADVLLQVAREVLKRRPPRRPKSRRAGRPKARRRGRRPRV